MLLATSIFPCSSLYDNGTLVIDEGRPLTVACCDDGRPLHGASQPETITASVNIKKVGGKRERIF